MLRRRMYVVDGSLPRKGKATSSTYPSHAVSSVLLSEGTISSKRSGAVEGLVLVFLFGSFVPT